MHVFAVNIKCFNQAFTGFPNFPHGRSHREVLLCELFMLLQIFLHGHHLVIMLNLAFDPPGIL